MYGDLQRVAGTALGAGSWRWANDTIRGNAGVVPLHTVRVKSTDIKNPVQKPVQLLHSPPASSHPQHLNELMI